MFWLKAVEIMKEIEFRASVQAKVGCRYFLNETVSV
jgi:hypothetical protein